MVFMVFEKAGSSTDALPPLPREETPLLGKATQLSSQSKTFANVFIAIVGAGVLGLPYTFKKTGWVFGVLMILAVSLSTYHCMMLLVYTRRKLESKQGFSKINSFGDLGYSVCGSFGRIAVDVMIVLSQAGFCVSYLMFIANTMAYVFNSSVPTVLGLRAKAFYIWAGFPFQLGLNSIPTLTHLAPISIFADVVDIGAMGIVMVEDVVMFTKHQQPNLLAFGGLNVLLYGLGVAIYAYEGVGVVLPLESEARDKEKFGRVLGLSMIFISLMYILFGVLGYFAFGDETKDIITTNLGYGLLSNLVQLGLCINLYFTFPLMMNPVYEVFERRFFEGRYCVWQRWLVVLLVSLVALSIPNFADFLSLVGSSVCVLLGFVLPSLFHLIVFKEERGYRGLLLDAVILIVGLIIAISGTWSSVMQIFAVRT
ncbi:amino acid transporter AVT3C-like [Macadamia integrifolia]|uniref:amino acid transporter AVT3C-like n=1 Tax=Macadamia integrifolia TaxID=60698 RepID=UPI001C4FF777|nr:amino acid transporter AVT3C-like [Macadamia integrifolia]XP_042508821.1 amino acid transporter AVT3C-like [Macadamia integrifolia]